jgi:hypothetical protein
VLLLLLCCVRLDAAELRLDAPVKVCRAEAFQSEVRKIVIHDVFDDHFAVDFPAGAMIWFFEKEFSRRQLLPVCG